jgi:hypothetical protein
VRLDVARGQRLRVYQAEAEKLAAARLGAGARALLGRRRVAEKRDECMQAEAAVRIQCSLRGRNERQQLRETLLAQAGEEAAAELAELEEKQRLAREKKKAEAQGGEEGQGARQGARRGGRQQRRRQRGRALGGGAEGKHTRERSSAEG